ncbi:molybdopterin synthase subunit MoaE [Hephaestia caeni]|uniref:Molybdopterin synthase catalytic subunit n=1 Tax=Hephaestia caeni TaxID=645617 RepID=A0A397PC62_9SPHN|nr:molybdenum cofactor biosynthesis protein MoaE [Hephaestia caeni]RIA47096.1 molybdopterin synthase subunit MoaE [Hephaestia caeni]
MIRVLVSPEPIDVTTELARIEALEAGAVATFTGIVRADDGVSLLDLEHYPGATETALETLAAEAVAHWRLTGAIIVHRIGAMRPGERIVLVATAASHRAAALDACACLIDRLKTEAPFWKRETRGRETRWVDARDADHAAADRWKTTLSDQ